MLFDVCIVFVMVLMCADVCCIVMRVDVLCRFVYH